MAEPQVPRLELPFFAAEPTELACSSRPQRRELAGLLRSLHDGRAGRSCRSEYLAVSGKPQTPRSAVRGLMQSPGLTLLACALVLGLTSSANAAEARDEAAVRARSEMAPATWHLFAPN